MVYFCPRSGPTSSADILKLASFLLLRNVGDLNLVHYNAVHCIKYTTSSISIHSSRIQYNITKGTLPFPINK